jgi:hypothetical protein
LERPYFYKYERWRDETEYFCFLAYSPSRGIDFDEHAVSLKRYPDTNDTKLLLRSRIALQAFPIIVFWERGGLGGVDRQGCLRLDGSGRVGIALYAVPGKVSGN